MDLILINTDHISVIYFDDKNKIIKYEMNNKTIIEKNFTDDEIYLDQKEKLKKIFAIVISIGK